MKSFSKICLLVWLATLVVSLDLCEARFTYGEVGVDACPIGYSPISDGAVCAEAAAALGGTYNAADSRNDGNDDTVCIYCGGCNPKTVFLSNIHGVSAKWLCAEAALEFRRALTSQSIPSGWRLATKAEVEANKNKVTSLLGTWDICKLGDGWQIKGSGYNHIIEPLEGPPYCC